MNISIVILNYKQKGLVRQCIKGIVNSHINLEYEIIFVDNNSKDGSADMVRAMFSSEYNIKSIQQHLPLNEIKLPELTVIESPENGGFSKGNNLGMKAAKGEYILIMNPDIAIVPGVIEKLYAFMEKNPETGIVGPRLLNPDGTIQYSCRKWPQFFMPLYRRTMFGSFGFAKKSVDDYLMKSFNHADVMDVDWLFGAFLLIRKSALEKIGLFDERFFMYFEDLDLCRRFWEAGYRVVYYGDVELIHYHHQYSAEKHGISGILSKGGRIHLHSGIKYFLKYVNQRLPRHSVETGQSGISPL